MTDEANARDASPAARMLRSWDSNASAWTEAVRAGKIASRRAGTDAAIVAAVLRQRAPRVIDVGCGEGWLARALSAQGREVIGVDASRALVDAARAEGGGTFAAMTYDELSRRADELGAPFDLAVCNFSLLEADLSPALDAVRAVLRDGGRLIVQTVHPWSANGDARYADGWRTETFATFGAAFAEAMPWYFRMLSSWLDAIGAGGFTIERCEEPLDAARGVPLSLLITARRNALGR